MDDFLKMKMLGDNHIMTSYKQYMVGYKQTKSHTSGIGVAGLIHWTLIWSSVDHYLRGMHGTPYKFFHMALICNLTAKESLYGCNIGVISRDTNNLR